MKELEQQQVGTDQQEAYAGAGWVIDAFRVPDISPLGRKVADILGAVWRGIYHLDEKAIRRVEWTNSEFMSVRVPGSLATWDFNRLTELVILAHDSCTRLEVRSDAPRCLRLVFHARAGREGRMSERHPGMEDAIKSARELYAGKAGD